MSKSFTIKAVRVCTMAPSAQAGTYYTPGASKHRLVESQITNPMSGYAN